MRCFGCHAIIDIAAGERVGFRDTCPSCSADLHTCRNCAHHDPGAQNQCREPSAEPVRDRERANRCEWFRPAAPAAQDAAGAGEADRARAALDALFRKG